MPVAFDSDVLSLLLRPETEPPNDPTTGKPVTHVKERLDFLVSELQREKVKIIVPAPALGEFLVVSDKAGPDYLSQIDKTAVFKIEPFDGKAASEAAALTRQAIHEGNKKLPATGHWQCIKTDRQIVAICRAVGVTKIYSNDADMKAIAAKAGLEVAHVHELPIPPADAPLLAMMQKTEDESEVPPSEPDRTVSVRAIAFALSILRRPPSEQTPVAAPESASEPAPDRPEDRHGAPEQPPPDFSAADPPPARSSE